MKKFQVKVFLKCKNKRSLCILFVPYHGVPYPWYKVHILTGIYEKKRSNFGDYDALFLDVDIKIVNNIYSLNLYNSSHSSCFSLKEWNICQVIFL